MTSEVPRQYMFVFHWNINSHFMFTVCAFLSLSQEGSFALGAPPSLQGRFVLWVQEAKMTTDSGSSCLFFPQRHDLEKIIVGRWERCECPLRSDAPQDWSEWNSPWRIWHQERDPGWRQDSGQLCPRRWVLVQGPCLSHNFSTDIQQRKLWGHKISESEMVWPMYITVLWTHMSELKVTCQAFRGQTEGQ